MNKYLLSLLVLLVPVSSFAVDLYHYSPIEGCSLRKAAGGSWQVVPPTEVGSDNFTIQISKANAAYSNFKYQGSWYAAKTECFKMSEAPSASSSSDESVVSTTPGSFHMTKGKFFVEPKFSFYMMNGTNMSGGTDPSGIVIEKYKPGIGLAAKFGYYFNDHSDGFLEINKFSGSQSVTGGGLNTTKNDSVLSFNLGYQYFISRKGSFLPYGELALGYNKLSQSLVVPGGTTTNYSGSGIGFILEAGTLYELSQSFALTGALNYTIMSFSELTQDGTTTPQTNTSGYSHLGINIGARYNF
jgi:hypothetical protein